MRDDWRHNFQTNPSKREEAGRSTEGHTFGVCPLLIVYTETLLLPSMYQAWWKFGKKRSKPYCPQLESCTILCIIKVKEFNRFQPLIKINYIVPYQMWCKWWKSLCLVSCYSTQWWAERDMYAQHRSNAISPKSLREGYFLFWQIILLNFQSNCFRSLQMNTWYTFINKWHYSYPVIKNWDKDF